MALCVFPIQTDAIVQGDVLLASLGAIIIGMALGTLHETFVSLAASALFQHLYRLAALCRSSEYQYHSNTSVVTEDSNLRESRIVEPRRGRR